MNFTNVLYYMGGLIAVCAMTLFMTLGWESFGGWADFELQAMVSLYFGLSMTLFAFWVDIRSAKSGDYAFWLYLFGVMAF